MRGQRVKPVDRIAPEGNAGPHLGFGNAQARPGGQQRQRAMEAGGIARGKQLLGIGSATGPAELPGQAQIPLQGAVVGTRAASPPRTATRAV